MYRRIMNSFILAGALTLIISTSGTTADQPRTAMDVYENHSLLVIPPLASDRLPEFYRGGFDVVRMLPDGSRFWILSFV